MPLTNINSDTLEKLSKDIYVLSGILERVLNEKTEVKSKVESSKNWIANQPAYLKFLQNLQNALHQRNLGVFSQLLTYFVKDVLGKDKDIVFDLYTFRNLPALKIESINDGCSEDIYEGNGGSIANIVSTGLRLIVLSRLKNRKFIILDEPDCWLKPDHIPSFAKIIGELSEKLKIQTIIVSHHDWNFFKDYGRVIRLYSDGKNLQTETLHDLNVTVDDSINYIQSVRLRNFMSHTDTELNLHPYLTCFVGENDIGKSVLSTALKSVAFGESSDSYIKHHTTEAQVLISLSDSMNILWQRFKQTSESNPQKVKYSLFRENALLFSEYSAHECPKFIFDVLNISKIEDIDVHIGNQKQPVFLLSSDVKPSDRAKILSLGKEAILVSKMMENIKSKTKANNQIIKDGERTFSSILKIEECLSNIPLLTEFLPELKNQYTDIVKLNENTDSLNNLYNSMSELLALNGYSNIEKVEKKYELFPVKEFNNFLVEFNSSHRLSANESLKYLNFNLNISDTSSLDKLINRLIITKLGVDVGTIYKKLEKPQLNDVSELSLSIERLSLAESVKKFQHINQVTFPSDNNNIANLSQDLEQISNLHNLLNNLKSQLNDNDCVSEKVNNELKSFILENKYCPTCHQTLNLKDYTN